MIVGHYEILKEIGRGGMGIVYQGRHTTIGQIVAIKALGAEWGAQPDMRNRFVNEAKSQALLNHPNVVNLYNFFEEDGKSYLVMEYIDGDTIERIIKKVGLIPSDRCVRIFKQVLNGIGSAHAKGIIHRDIKPSNIIVSKDGVVKITDFGIAKIATDFQKTQTGIKVGTLSYMSPEYIKGNALTHLTDIYALGITLYQMVTGTLPFRGDSEYQLMKAIVEYEPPSPVEFYPHIPKYLEEAILKAIRKNQGERFQSAAEFAAALDEPQDETIVINTGSRQNVPFETDRKEKATVAVVRPASGSKWTLVWSALIAALIIMVAAGYVILKPGQSVQEPTTATSVPKDEAGKMMKPPESSGRETVQDAGKPATLEASQTATVKPDVVEEESVPVKQSSKQSSKKTIPLIPPKAGKTKSPAAGVDSEDKKRVISEKDVEAPKKLKIEAGSWK
jgi:serine/threonine protein kinase